MVRLTRDITPLFERLRHLQWIKQGEEPIRRRQDFLAASQGAQRSQEPEGASASDIAFQALSDK